MEGASDASKDSKSSRESNSSATKPDADMVGAAPFGDPSAAPTSSS